MPDTQNTMTVGAAIAAFLETCGVKAAFGVISIHNMPILDAMHQRGQVRFVMARGEAGATNMADAYARTTGGLGVTITSTGVLNERREPWRPRCARALHRTSVRAPAKR